ncbi:MULTISPECIES: hypothetical protein [Bradyrhizobium]|uniref:hypothetical protein n=1 Tax=Bradyrhizobium TaxID=374 RepID=UPI0003FDA266|nr:MULTISPECIES: hypothetical protein [Bradyrhizobium]UFW51845.1 hypothetical protein BaraCB756_13055 [Bradyrhizobium arachidis]SFV15929.1 hypothetical protein SAMN05192541_12481 [Bradyrhizobium arachidis]
MTAAGHYAGAAVMAGHSRPKDGVASLAYVPAIHELSRGTQNVDARDKPAHDVAPPAIIIA